VTQFSGAEKWSLFSLSSRCCFFLVFSETHSSSVSPPQSSNSSHCNLYTTRSSYPCSCTSPTASLPAPPWADPLVVWSRDFAQCPGQDARGLWLLFQPSLSKKPGHLPVFVVFIHQPWAALASSPSVSLGQLFPLGSGSWGAVQIPRPEARIHLARLAWLACYG